ncbi:hypothetical protein D187_002740 [Cystobacter fuscus DSM 2262]|uniref:Uncharacterized protein n=1 Tax=Cystobacter fuscus (strain ATCC 25194 / DSM 2262 / NBRC 100088 / M29) TaxID=1242864 RepID=S9QE23_CYSF2|nr:hypothetical protein D187_002740 [Cystobacter fuscus DSM 2262]
MSELRTCLSMLLGPEVALALNLRRGHGLSFEALHEKLVSLSERDLIQVYSVENEQQVMLACEDFGRALAESRPRGSDTFAYQLTARGGATWEHYARPDWSRYLTAWSSLEPRECVIEANSREAAEAEYRLHEVDGSGHQPVAESKRGEALVPWQATYWKVLPTGYRLRYDWVPRPAGFSGRKPLPGRKRWYVSLALDE